MLTEADLPSIEELTAQSDYTVFLKKNVPEALRRRALRKLWVSDPVLANLDGLNDYDDDYTIVTAMTMDDTSYKIGRGCWTTSRNRKRRNFDRRRHRTGRAR